jgi:hypothetical protein
MLNGAKHLIADMHSLLTDPSLSLRMTKHKRIIPLKNKTPCQFKPAGRFGVETHVMCLYV